MGVYIHAYLWIDSSGVSGIGLTVTEAQEDAKKSAEFTTRLLRQIGKELNFTLDPTGLDGKPVLIAINGDDAASAHNAYNALARAIRSETYEQPRDDRSPLDPGSDDDSGGLDPKLPDQGQGPKGHQKRR